MEVSIASYYASKDSSASTNCGAVTTSYAIRTLEIELAKVEDSIRTFNRHAVYPDYLTELTESAQSRLYKEKDELESAIRILRVGTRP